MTTNKRLGTRKRKLLRFTMFASVIFAIVHFFDSSYSAIYYGMTTLVILYTGFKTVTNRDLTMYLLGLNLILVQLSTYAYLSNQHWWFNFLGVEIALSITLGIIVLLFANLIANMILGSIMYGNLKTYSEEMQRRQFERRDDPYGDKHAQQILNNTDN